MISKILFQSYIKFECGLKTLLSIVEPFLNCLYAFKKTKKRQYDEHFYGLSHGSNNLPVWPSLIIEQ